jgi:hypothetical protein
VPSSWSGEDELQGTLKRQKTGVKTVTPCAVIKGIHGTSALKWITNDSIVAGSSDHQLKVLDV